MQSVVVAGWPLEMAGGAAQRNMTEEAIFSEKRVRAELGGGRGSTRTASPASPCILLSTQGWMSCTRSPFEPRAASFARQTVPPEP